MPIVFFPGYAIIIESKRRGRRCRREESYLLIPFPQRTGGWCEPVKRQEVPLSKLSVKTGRVSPLALFKRFGGILPYNPGGNAGNILVPVYAGAVFYFPEQKNSILKPKP